MAEVANYFGRKKTGLGTVKVIGLYATVSSGRGAVFCSDTSNYCVTSGKTCYPIALWGPNMAYQSQGIHVLRWSTDPSMMSAIKNIVSFPQMLGNENAWRVPLEMFCPDGMYSSGNLYLGWYMYSGFTACAVVAIAVVEEV